MLTDHRRRPHQTLRLRGQPANPGQHNLRQRPRQPPVAGGDQLLNQIRVPPRSGKDRGDVPGVASRAQRPDQLTGLGLGEPVQLDAADPLPTDQLGQQLTESRLTRPVRPVRHDEQHPTPAHAADQEHQKIQGVPVGPMHILDHQHRQPSIGHQPLHELQPAPEHPAPAGSGRICRCTRIERLSISLQPLLQFTVRAIRQLGPHLTQEIHKRRVRHRRAGQQRAPTDQDPTVDRRLSEHLIDQPTLPDPGLTTNQHSPRRGACFGQEPAHLLHLRSPPHKGTALRHSRHTDSMQAGKINSIPAGPIARSTEDLSVKITRDRSMQESLARRLVCLPGNNGDWTADSGRVAQTSVGRYERAAERFGERDISGVVRR